MTSTPPAHQAAPDRSLHLQCVCTLLVALASSYVSYQHGHTFALRFGADTTTATLWPLIVDGLLTTATIELWKTGHHHQATGRWKAWLSFTLAIGLSLCANIAAAPQLNPLTIAVAACPPLALLLSVELLNQALKRRKDTASSVDQEPTEYASPESPSPDTGEHPSETSASSEAPNTSAKVPTRHTAIDNVPGHSTPSTNADSMPPHGDHEDALWEQAYRLDAEHWHHYQRPISAETLRRKLRVGSTRARTLTRHIRQQRQPGAVLAAVE